MNKSQVREPTHVPFPILPRQGQHTRQHEHIGLGRRSLQGSFPQPMREHIRNDQIQENNDGKSLSIILFDPPKRTIRRKQTSQRDTSHCAAILYSIVLAQQEENAHLMAAADSVNDGQIAEVLIVTLLGGPALPSSREQ